VADIARRATAPVAFSALAWDDDLRHLSAAGRRVAVTARARLEREGQPLDGLRACDVDARDGTSLPGCVKAYIPPPLGDWGIVYKIARDPTDGRLFLDHLAFGRRHPGAGRRTGPSVYEVADRRLHDRREA